ncbi:MAG: hypothetical protein KatS3mg118_0264 [Paracoccaceae bacterium]|nr:MAG: hypothetical protein KatS3mg118_0264 [Paracoccaceae bacterium]
MRARLRPRHLLVIVSFILLVLVPAAAVNWYLHARAADQYVSRAALTRDLRRFPRLGPA